jgi:hypothetical protein
MKVKKKPDNKEPVFTPIAAAAYIKFMEGVAEGRRRDAEKLKQKKA